MPTILADTFLASLGRLTGQEQKAVKLTAFDLQSDPDRPGMSFHRIDASRDPNLWSLRVDRDIRIVVHKVGATLTLLWVAHHDAAYAWAERRRVETHPATGALQIVEVREKVVEIPVPKQGDLFTAAGRPAPRLFERLGADDLARIGVPADWVTDVLCADEERFFDIARHLPPEAAERLLAFATDGRLPEPEPIAASADPFDHPDTQRRFRLLEDAEELRAALDAPFERWAIFLHPTQRGLVARRFNGPARVVGSAGTGKTVVALHRVRHLLGRDAGSRVLLATFSEPLARELARKLALLLADRPGAFERVTIASFERAARDLLTLASGREARLADRDLVRWLVAKVAEAAGVSEFSSQFLVSEWENVIDPWRIDSLEAYAGVPRMGRKNRLGAKQRERLWQVFEAVRKGIAAKGLETEASVFERAGAAFLGRPPFDHVVVDEAQDLGVAELRFLAGLVGEGADRLFFAGDIGQRIFRQPFSWKGLGIDVRGRSTTLKVNYRTSQQIRAAADRLLPKSVRDVDGLEDERRGTVSVFEGPEPEIFLAEDEAAEVAAAAAFLTGRVADGVAPSDIGLFVRSEDQVARARAVVDAAGLEASSVAGAEGRVFVSTMHLAKGLEFRVVLVVACDEEALPLAARIEDVADDFELDEVTATERQLLYVALTRARERVFVSAVEPGSAFLEDIGDVVL